MEIKDKLRKAREQKGVSQRQAAAEMGISHSYYSELETGKCDNPTLFFMQTIAEYYNCSLDELFSRD